MTNRKFIIDMEPGDRQDAVYRISNFQVRESNNGNLYASFFLSDCTGELPVKMWDIGYKSSILDEDTLRMGGLARLNLNVKSYKGGLQGEATMIRPVQPTDSYDLDDLLETAPEPAQEMFDEMVAMAENFVCVDLGRVVKEALMRKKDVLMTIPGGKRMHHNVKAGLLYHMVRMARAGKALASIYPEVDGDLIAAGAIVHDLGKIDEFVLEPGTGFVKDYTPEGDLLNHNIMGIFLIRDICKDLNADPEVFRVLSHMIESHHGLPERGSAIPPIFIEAEILHHLDMMDSRIWIYDREYEEMDPGTVSDGQINALDHYIYKPDLYKDLDEDSQ